MHFAIRAKECAKCTKFEAFKHTNLQKATVGPFSKPGLIEKQIQAERNLKAAQPHFIP